MQGSSKRSVATSPKRASARSLARTKQGTTEAATRLREKATRLLANHRSHSDGGQRRMAGGSSHRWHTGGPRSNAHPWFEGQYACWQAW
eukprot:scaffold94181_cov59-Phaeocystis_antarctica.AAC.10